MNDPQQGVRPGMWQTHDGIVHLSDMDDEHVLNAYKTAKRFDNPKADDVYTEIWMRGLEYRVT